MRSLAIIALALVGSAAQAVEVGDTRAAVIEELGFPMGELELGDRERLMFEAGDVTIANGVVTKVNLKSAAELKRDAEAKENMAAYWAERRAEDLAERLDHGRMWLDYLELESTPITENDVKSIMAHWNQLRKDFPNADIAAEYDATLALAKERAAEIKQRREEQRIAALERRVAAAEERAAAAEQQASNYQRYTYTYPAYYYPQPRTVVVVGNGAYCPPIRPKPGLQASYQSDNFSVSYSSVGSRFRNVTPSSPIIITRSNGQ